MGDAGKYIMIKYEVWGKEYEDGTIANESVKLGEFDRLQNALIFRDAYSNRYSHPVEIYVFRVSENFKKKLFKLAR